MVGPHQCSITSRRSPPPADLSVFEPIDDAPERDEQGAQKPLEPSQQQVEVEGGGGKHSVAAVAVAALEVVATHAVLGLEVTDNRLDRGAALHLAADGLGDAADLAGDPGPESVGIVVAAAAMSEPRPAR